MHAMPSQVPPIRRVIPKENYILEIHFQNGEVRAYDVKPLLDTDPEMAMLKDPLVFKDVRLSPYDGRCSVIWHGLLRIGAAELYEGSWIVKLPGTEWLATGRVGELWSQILSQSLIQEV